MKQVEQTLFHNLTIKSDVSGGKFFLDDFELRGVVGYELKGITHSESELTLTILVSTPNLLVDDI